MRRVRAHARPAGAPRRGWAGAPKAVAVAAAIAVAGLLCAAPAHASIALGTVVSADPANYTPQVQDGAVYKFVQIGSTMYAGGTFGSVKAAAGTRPSGTFTRTNLVAFNASTGSISSMDQSFDGPVWALATNGSSLYVGGTFSTVGGVARRSIVKLDPTTGAVDAAFNARLGGNVTDAVVVNGRLIVAGSFPGKLRALNLTTGADTRYITASITGTVSTPTASAGATAVYRFAVDPAGTRLVGVGNFTAVDGATHYRALMLDLGATAATASAWNYAPLANYCAAAREPDYLRDVDFSPDGSYFVIVGTGYVPQTGGIGRDLCDSAERFETGNLNPTRPTWINYTGGDTLHSVAVTDQAVYVQGHQRWLDNPLGRDTAGPGAVARPGIGAIDPNTGLALSWNPTKGRGDGGRDLYVTSAGLWVGSDTQLVAGETRKRIALMPVG